MNQKMKRTMATDQEQVVETLEDFRKEKPNFSIYEMEKNIALVTFGGQRINLAKGQKYCFNSDKPPGANMKAAKKGFMQLYNPYCGQNLDGKTIGVWRSGGIGDLLFMRPILVHLKKLYPTCKIYLATMEKYHGMVKFWDDCLDGYEGYPFPIEHMLEEADYHITFQGLIERCREANNTDVYSLFAKWCCLDPEEIDFTVPMELPSMSQAVELLRGMPVIQTAASSPVRTPRFRTFIKAINHLTNKGFRVVISDGPNNSKRTNELVSCCDNPEMVYNLAHYTDHLIDAINLVSEAPVVVAPDSSHIHFAGAHGVPCVGIYGAFPGRCRTTHYKNCYVVETPENKKTCDHGGRECFLHNSTGCNFHERCWNNIDDNEVLKAIDKALEKD